MALRIVTVADKAVTTAGTQVQVSTSEIPARSITIQALPANTGKIYVGDADCASNRCMAELSAGEFFVLGSDDQMEEFYLADVWIDSSVSGEGIHLSYTKRR